jgi:hypothetical protein
MKLKLIIGLFLVMLSFGWTLPVNATTCRQIDNHQVCLINIKRSAKYYWEYRVILSIDGKKKPMQIYDCKQDQVIYREGQITILQNAGIRSWICSLF